MSPPEDQKRESALSQRFFGKCFFITGAGSGIGRATVIKLHKQGALCFATDITTKTLPELEYEAEDYSKRVYTEHCDVKDSESCKRALEQCMKEFGHIDGVFNCAGINPTDIPTEEVTDKYYDDMMDVNVRGLFNMTRAAIPYMKSGSVFVNTSSICGVQGGSGFAVYCATKHAIIGFSKSIALELGPKGIRTNVIAPGYIDTPTNAAVVQGKEAMEQSAASCALKRMGKAEEIADVVCFLFSDESSYMNGAVVQIDGGDLKDRDR